MGIVSASLKEELNRRAEAADRSPDWPAESWDLLKKSGALGISIPALYGGTERNPVDRQIIMEEIASSCLTTAFILSQREAAVRQILKGPIPLQERYLPLLANGTAFMTVGLSQLTTSRQHLGPALRATRISSGGYQLNGEIPWVTGADQAAAIVVGATLPDSAQIMLVLPTDVAGVSIEPPLPLSALVGSRTSLIRCQKVVVDSDCLLAGPTESVLGKIGGGGLDTSCLAIGLAQAGWEFINHEANLRGDLTAPAARLNEAIGKARGTLHALAQGEADSDRTMALRVTSTQLALRTSQAGLMVAKGAGFIEPHAAQRRARQALFFLVWSCPRPVAEGVLAELTEI